MGKNNKGGFTNRSATKLSDRNKVEVMREKDLFDILDDNEIYVILKQITAARMHGKGHGPFPTYIDNFFVNLSAAKRIYKFVDERITYKLSEKSKKHRKHGDYYDIEFHAEDLSEDDIESMKSLLFRIYRASKTNGYPEQSQDRYDRERYLSKAFCMLDPLGYALAKKLKIHGFDPDKSTTIDKPKTRELVVLSYGDPIKNISSVSRCFDAADVTVDEKVKHHVFGYLYYDREIQAMGTALTVSRNDSDFVSSIYDEVKGMKKTMRSEILDATFQAYKYNNTLYPRISSDKEFVEKNKKLMKKLTKHDAGFRKAKRRVESLHEQAKAKKKDRGTVLRDPKPYTRKVEKDGLKKFGQ